MTPTLHSYSYALTHLKRGGSRYGIAPHKPVLVLTLIDLVENGTVVDNRFEANTDLVGTFLETVMSMPYSI